MDAGSNPIMDSWDNWIFGDFVGFLGSYHGFLVIIIFFDVWRWLFANVATAL